MWYINNSFTQKKIICWKKSKTSRLWILDIGPILEGICAVSVMKYDLKQLIYTFCWTKEESGRKYFEKLSFVIQCRWYIKAKSADFTKDICSHRAKRKIFWIMAGVNCWSNYADRAHDFFEAFVFHGSAICFRSSDCDASFLCSVPSFMPSFGEKD